MRPSFLTGWAHEGLLTSLFVPEGRVVGQGRVATMRVVPALDELEDGSPSRGGIAEASAPQQFALERGEEALAHRVVVGVAHRAHRGPDAKLLAALPVSDGGVLAAVIRMMDDVPRQALHDGHV